MLWADGTAVRGAPVPQEIVPSTADGKKGVREYPLTRHCKYRAHRGACGKTRVVPHYRRPKHQHLRNGRHEMRARHNYGFALWQKQF